MKKIFAAVLTAGAMMLALASPAAAQSGCPTIITGAVLTAAQWNACFQAKNDNLGYTPLNIAGGTMSGRLVTSAPGASLSGFNLFPGTAPGSPANGDLWATSAGLFVEINGTTVGPLASSVGGPFTGQVLDSGATTTSPGYYVSITGDTVPRVRVGTNSTDIASIALGPGNANRDTFLERFGVASLRLGSPDAASPVAQTLGVQNVLTGTSNAAGANLTIQGSRGTGTGAGGSIIFQVAPAGSSGSSQNPLTTLMQLSPGAVIMNAPLLMQGNAIVGGSGANASMTVESTSSGSPSGDNLNLFGSTINLSGLISGLKTINFGGSGGGVTINIGTAADGINALKLWNGSGGGQQLVPASGVSPGTITFPATTTTLSGNAVANVFTANQTIQSNSASSLLVQSGGGATALQVDASIVSLAAGVKLAGATTGGLVAISAIDSGSNTNIALDGKGSGNVRVGGFSTGGVQLGAGGGGVTMAGPVTMTLGSDATGDIWYRNSGGQVTRLGVGSNGQVLQVNTGLPSWQAGSSAGSITQGSTTIGGTCPNGQLLFSSSATLGCEAISSTLTAGYGVVAITGTNPTIGVSLTNNFTSLGADITIPNANTYVTGPCAIINGGGTCATAGSISGVWRVDGNVAISDTANAANLAFCRITDGTTTYATTPLLRETASAATAIQAVLVVTITSPAGNPRMDCQTNTTTGVMRGNQTSTGNSQIVAVRIQ